MSNVILDHVKANPPGWVFSALDFSSMAPRNTIDQNLLRLAKSGHIRKIATGLFCTPKQNPILGDINPSLDEIVQAYARKFGYSIQVHPAKAANLLGLSQHVTAKNIYLTDGPTRSLVLGGQDIILKHVCPRKLLGIGTKAGLIVQALYACRSKDIDSITVKKIKELMKQDDVHQLMNWMPLLPGWMQRTIKVMI